MLFLRGDVAPAEKMVVYPISAKPFGRREVSLFPHDFRNLGLITGIGSAPAECRFAERLVPDGCGDENAWREACRTGKAISSSGEIRLDAGKRTFAVNTPKSVTATLDRGDIDSRNSDGSERRHLSGRLPPIRSTANRST